MRHKNDILWKVVLEEVFDDLLRFISSDAEQVYDMDRGFEFLDKELAEMNPEPEEKSDTRFADKLVKAFHRDGAEEWVLLHIEIQGDSPVRTEFAKRMFRYFYRIWDRYQQPVSAVAIYTGQDGKKMPLRFEYAYRSTRILYEYHSFAILDFSDEELDNSDNPFAQVVLAAKTLLLEGKIPQQELLDRKILIAKRLLGRGFPGKKVRAIFTFLENCILFEDTEMNRIFKQQVKSDDKENIMGIDEYIKEVAKEEGREEGIEKGRSEKETAVIKNLLAMTEFSDEMIASLVSVSIAFVKEIREGKR